MTSKERVIKQLNFEKTDRVPFNFWMDRRLLNKYEEELGPDFRLNYYDADVIETFPLLAWPMGEGEERDGSFWFHTPIIKEWEDADKLVMPDPNDEKVYDHIRSYLQKYPDKAIFVNIPGPFTIGHNMRLLDNLYYDVYDYPEEVHKLCKRIMDVYNVVIKNVIDLPITAIYFQDDVCASTGLIFSLSMVKQFIFDYFREGIDMAKKAGKFVVYHSDGKVTEILDTLVEMGINAVNPLQPVYNNFKEFKAKYHGKLAVYGGIDNTIIIPDGSEDDVRNHIKYIFDTLGSDGGLIMSSHDIPIHCPRRNVDVMVETIKACRY